MKRFVRTVMPFAALAISIALASCAPADSADATKTTTALPTVVTPTPVSTPEPAPIVTPAPIITPALVTAPATDAAAPAVAAGPPLDATNIVGTKWSAAGYELAFLADGALKINGDTDGTWKLENSTLTIDVGGSPYEAKVEGDKITYDGSPLERLN